jgi:AcrR family transcriptional regulator
VSSEPEPTWLKSGPRPRYTREEIILAALALIDRDGAEGFTMRRLAGELGLGVMTLYGYVRSKEEMVYAVTGYVFREGRAEPARRGGWEPTLRHGLQDLHLLCRQHPNLVTLTLAQNHAPPGLFELRERLLSSLREAGLDRQSALRALGVLLHYVLGFSAAQAGDAPIELPCQLRDLPVDQFPNLSRAADDYAEHISDEAFEYGLDLILSGIKTDARRQRKAARARE